MRLLTFFFLTLTLSLALGCDLATREKSKAESAKESMALRESQGNSEVRNAPAKADSAVRMLQPMEMSRGGGGDRASHAQIESKRISSEDSERSTGSVAEEAVSLASISTVYAATEAIDRKIIRNADLTLETESPTEGLRRITAAAESQGGFVVTSEFKQNPVAAGAKPTQSVTVVARVPASQFASALEQIRNAGDRVVSEKVSGQDVSEEYLDLEAHLRNKKALEAQFLDIMKQARKVQDALDVQSQLADVRTEIERLEGRRRFLENQSALSTITTTLQMPQPIVATTTSGFGATIKRASGDAVDTVASIVLFVIQAVIVLVPIGIFFGLPAWLVWKMIRRRIVVRKPEPSPIPSK